MNTFSPRHPITGLMNAHYKGKRHTQGGVGVGGEILPLNPQNYILTSITLIGEDSPYDLIPMSKSVHKEIRKSLA